MESDLIYLDTYILQQDMRIRLPKAILSNLEARKGETQFDIYLDKANQCLVLKKHNHPEENTNGEGK